MNIFSSSTKELIKQSRLLAIELGHNYISASDFMLADCMYNSNNSIKGFAFDNENQLQHYIDSQRKGGGTIFADLNQEQLPITKDLETMIKLSKKEMNLYGHSEIQPYHLFLASFKSKYPLLVQKPDDSTSMYDKLISYYQSFGINFTLKNSSPFSRLKQILGIG